MKDILSLEGAEDYVTKPEDLQDLSGPLVILVKDIADKLERHYPGWLWAVQPFEFGSIIKVFSLRVSGEYGYIIKVSEIQDDPSRKLAIQAGGEILERYGLPRKKYRRRYLKNKMRDIRGNLIPDITDKDAKAQRQDRDRNITAAVNEGKLTFQARDVERSDGTVHRELHMHIGGDDA